MTQRSQQFLARLRQAREQANKMASAHDQAVLKLSSAGLAVSFAFVRFSGDDVTALGALQTAWGFWLLSTVSLFGSFWFGMFGSCIRERSKRRGVVTKGPSAANSWILWLNFGSGLFYVVGLCAFVVFLFMNTPGGD